MEVMAVTEVMAVIAVMAVINTMNRRMKVRAEKPDIIIENQYQEEEQC